MKETTGSLSAFFAENAERAENVTVVISDRFKDADGKPLEWEIRPLPSSEVKNARNMCYVKDASGRRVIDEEMAAAKCIALSVVYPDLNDPELQASWGARNASDLLNNMLYMNEYNKVGEVFNKLNLSSNENFEKNVETVKNS